MHSGKNRFFHGTCFPDERIFEVLYYLLKPKKYSETVLQNDFRLGKFVGDLKGSFVEHRFRKKPILFLEYRKPDLETLFEHSK